MSKCRVIEEYIYIYISSCSCVGGVFKVLVVVMVVCKEKSARSKTGDVH